LRLSGTAGYADFPSFERYGWRFFGQIHLLVQVDLGYERPLVTESRGARIEIHLMDIKPNNRVSLFSPTVLLVGLLFILATNTVYAQYAELGASEYSEDGVPVLMKNLPDWESVKSSTVWIKTKKDLRMVSGAEPILNSIDLIPGVEAVSASYPEGILLLIEYPTPQMASAADEKYLQAVAGEPNILYRRIGNYAAFLLNVSNPEAGNTLLSKIEYRKTVQWLGKDPNYQKKLERYLALGMGSVVIGTLFAVAVSSIVLLCIGIIVGLIYYKIEQRRRRTLPSCRNQAGLITLNLEVDSKD